MCKYVQVCASMYKYVQVCATLHNVPYSVFKFVFSINSSSTTLTTLTSLTPVTPVKRNLRTMTAFRYILSAVDNVTYNDYVSEEVLFIVHAIACRVDLCTVYFTLSSCNSM